jgi:hypothetical protein
MRINLINKSSLITCLFILFLVTFYQTRAEPATNNKIDLSDNKWINNRLVIFDTRFAASHLDDNNFEKGVYIFDLSSRSESWYLTIYSLNECNVDVGGVNSFEPKMVGWVGSNRIEGSQVEENKFKITVYQNEYKQLPANILLTFDKNKKLQSVELSGFVDQNALPDRVIPVKYEPLLDKEYKYADCPILLRGIE